MRVGALGVGGGVGVAFHGSGDVIALIKWGGWQWAVSAHPRCPLRLHPSNPPPPPHLLGESPECVRVIGCLRGVRVGT